MFLQDSFIRFYDFRPFRSIILNRIIGNITKIFGLFANIVLPIYFRIQHYYGKRQKLIESAPKGNFIVCLTTFPNRINKVWLVLECIVRQTLLPQTVILYLSKEQFPDIYTVPDMLRNFANTWFVIRLVDGDIRSHKKYWYAISDYPNKDIVTLDDDIIYHSKTLEMLYYSQNEAPKIVTSLWYTHIRWNNGKVLLPSAWGGEPVLYKPTNEMLFGSGGGTYFPKGSLVNANIDICELMQICPYADDLWLNTVIRLNGYRVYCIKRISVSIPEWHNRNNKKLCTINNNYNQNDVQFKNILNYVNHKYSLNPYRKDT